MCPEEEDNEQGGLRLGEVGAVHVAAVARRRRRVVEGREPRDRKQAQLLHRAVRRRAHVGSQLRPVEGGHPNRSVQLGHALRAAYPLDQGAACTAPAPSAEGGEDHDFHRYRQHAWVHDARGGEEANSHDAKANLGRVEPR